MRVYDSIHILLIFVYFFTQTYSRTYENSIHNDRPLLRETKVLENNEAENEAYPSFRKLERYNMRKHHPFREYYRPYSQEEADDERAQGYYAFQENGNEVIGDGRSGRRAEYDGAQVPYEPSWRDSRERYEYEDYAPEERSYQMDRLARSDDQYEDPELSYQSKDSSLPLNSDEAMPIEKREGEIEGNSEPKDIDEDVAALGSKSAQEQNSQDQSRDLRDTDNNSEMDTDEESESKEREVRDDNSVNSDVKYTGEDVSDDQNDNSKSSVNFRNVGDQTQEENVQDDSINRQETSDDLSNKKAERDTQNSQVSRNVETNEKSSSNPEFAENKNNLVNDFASPRENREVKRYAASWTSDQAKQLSDSLAQIKNHNIQVDNIRNILNEIGVLVKRDPENVDKRNLKEAGCGVDQGNKKKPEKLEQVATLNEKDKNVDVNDSNRKKRQNNSNKLKLSEKFENARSSSYVDGESSMDFRNSKQHKTHKRASHEKYESKEELQLQNKIDELKKEAKREVQQRRSNNHHNLRNRRGITTLLDVENAYSGPTYEDSLKPLVRRRREDTSSKKNSNKTESKLPLVIPSSDTEGSQKNIEKGTTNQISNVKNPVLNISQHKIQQLNNQINHKNDSFTFKMLDDTLKLQVEKRNDDELQLHGGDKLLLQNASVSLVGNNNSDIFEKKKIDDISFKLVNHSLIPLVRKRRADDSSLTEKQETEANFLRRKRFDLMPENQMVYRPFQAQQDSEEEEEGAFDDDVDDGFMDKRQAYYEPDFERQSLANKHQVMYGPDFRNTNDYNYNAQSKEFVNKRTAGESHKVQSNKNEFYEDYLSNQLHHSKRKNDWNPDHSYNKFERNKRNEGQYSQMHVGGLVSQRASSKTKIMDNTRAKRGNGEQNINDQTPEFNHLESEYFGSLSQENDNELTRNKRV